MKIFRVAQHSFIKDLSGEGARLYGGRWNKKGDAMLYFSEHLSLCVLELLAHMDYQFFGDKFSFLEAEIPNPLVSEVIRPDKISKNWRSNPPNSRTQDFGSQWIRKQEQLALTVPSSVLPEAKNILLNPRHPSITRIKMVRIAPLVIDTRVFS